MKLAGEGEGGGKVWTAEGAEAEESPADVDSAA